MSKDKIINLTFVILLLAGAVILSIVAVKKFDAASPDSMARATQGPVFKNITPAVAADLIKNKKAEPAFVILDVRTPQEFHGGRLEGAINYDYYSRDFQKGMAGLDKGATYLVYCRTGNRSGKTLEIMKQLGFTKAYNVLGGIVQWTREGYTLVR
ncbi:MAG: rhodanese-like domain-containing protein [Candidatus Adiutricales bacterium]